MIPKKNKWFKSFNTTLFIILINILFFSCTIIDEDVEVKNDTTNSNGEARFTDSSTGEEVIVVVQDSSEKRIAGIDIQFFDSNEFEMFILEDPSEIYSPCLRVFSHNSIHSITTYIESDVPRIREVDNNSVEGKAIVNLTDYVKANGIHSGCKTPEQLERESEVYLFILKVVGIDISIITDTAGKIAEVSGAVSNFEEPECYDVYYLTPQNPITTTLKFFIPKADETTTTTTGGGDIDIQDDFESGLDIGGKWREEGDSGTWHIEPGHFGNFLNNDPSMLGSPGSFLIANSTNYSDYTIIADMGYGSMINGHPSIVFRYQDPLNSYKVALGNYDDHEFYLNKDVNGSGIQLGKYKDFLIGVPNLWNTFKIVVVGNSITIYINDIFVDTVYDSTFSSGEVGFSSGGGTSLDHNFDNIFVCNSRDLDCDGIPDD